MLYTITPTTQNAHAISGQEKKKEIKSLQNLSAGVEVSDTYLD
jgi:hypothetical protein